MSKPYIITIARTFGSGGKTLGINLSEELGIPCYEDQIIHMASDYSGINPQMFAKVDEKLRGFYIAKKLAGFPDIKRVAQPSERDFTSDDNLFNIQAEIIRQLSKTESCIIIGRCGNIILKDKPNVINVFVDADEDTCNANVRRRLCVNRTEAQKLIEKTDRYRAEYYKYYSGGLDWKDPRYYDIMINSTNLGMRKCAELVKEMVRIKLGENFTEI
ncbi:MAG: cytidylate kinase-like family protein [Lachnospiraceae bacterium]|nr:cytidylate kinase-like family protein [Lachnospiraceae bacterium]